MMRRRIVKTPNCGAHHAFRQGRKNLTGDNRALYPGARRMLRRRIGGLGCSTEIKRSPEVVYDVTSPLDEVPRGSERRRWSRGMRRLYRLHQPTSKKDQSDS